MEAPALMVLRYRATDSVDRGRTEALKVVAWVRAALDLDDDAVVSVASHPCSEDGCKDAVATILLLRPGQATQSIKLGKPLGTVTQADVRAALQPVIGRRTSAPPRSRVKST